LDRLNLPIAVVSLDGVEAVVHNRLKLGLYLAGARLDNLTSIVNSLLT
jgi:hypothetical protein